MIPAIVSKQAKINITVDENMLQKNKSYIRHNFSDVIYLQSKLIHYF